MDPDTPFDVLSDPQAISRIVCYALGSQPVQPYTQETLQAALSSLPPALFDQLTLTDTSLDVIANGRRVFVLSITLRGRDRLSIWGFLPVFHGDQGDVYFFESVLDAPYTLMTEGEYLEVPMVIAA